MNAKECKGKTLYVIQFLKLGKNRGVFLTEWYQVMASVIDRGRRKNSESEKGKKIR